MTTWFAVIAVGLGSLAFRATPLLLAGHHRPGPRFQRMLGFVGPGVLGAILATALFSTGGEISWPGLASVLAIVGGFVAVRRTGNVAHALVIGLPIYWVVGALG